MIDRAVRGDDQTLRLLRCAPTRDAIRRMFGHRDTPVNKDCKHGGTQHEGADRPVAINTPTAMTTREHDPPGRSGSPQADDNTAGVHQAGAALIRTRYVRRQRGVAGRHGCLREGAVATAADTANGNE